MHQEATGTELVRRTCLDRVAPYLDTDPWKPIELSMEFNSPIPCLAKTG